MSRDLAERPVDLRLRERSQTIAALVTAATRRATQALADSDPLRSLALLDLAADDLVAATEFARQRALMDGRSGGGA